MLTDHAGTIIRIRDDGSVPDDNPFVGLADSRPEIYSYGHRNVQGLAIHPFTGALWANEHGPQGGDEVNLVGGLAGRSLQRVMLVDNDSYGREALLTDRGAGLPNHRVSERPGGVYSD
jgi:hypothetical protein